MWTCAQLAAFATALDTTFPLSSFAASNNKTPQQVKDTLGFLVLKPIFEYAEEGQKVARKFHREMKTYQKETEKVMAKVHRMERREGHWAAEGMERELGKGNIRKETEGGKGKGRGRGKGKKNGPLSVALAGGMT